MEISERKNRSIQILGILFIVAVMAAYAVLPSMVQAGSAGNDAKQKAQAAEVQPEAAAARAQLSLVQAEAVQAEAVQAEAVQVEAVQVEAVQTSTTEARAFSGSQNGGRQVTSLEISKDVTGVGAPGYAITLDKASSESEMTMAIGEDRPVTFTIQVGAAPSDSYSISGNIYVNNTGDWPANVTAVSDTVWYKAGGPAWLPAATSVATTVPLGSAAISTGQHVYTYSGTFTLPVPLASVTSMSNLIEITIDNHPNDGVHTFHSRQDFTKPSAGESLAWLGDVETITPDTGLAYTIDSVTINGSAVSPSGPWQLDLAQAPFEVIVEKTLHASAAGDYVLNNKALIGNLEDEVEVIIHVPEEPRLKGAVEGFKLDENLAPVAGVTIQLMRGEEVIASAVTDEAGHYSFSGLALRDYTVHEVVPAGWKALSAESVEVSLSGKEAVRVDFQNARLASISGTKWNDLNGNGLREENEPGLGGVLISLSGEGIFRQAVTAADGSYSFTNLPAGSYTVSEKVPDGWANTTPVSRTVTVEYGDQLGGIDFLNAVVEVAGEVVIPPDTGTGTHAPAESLPYTGFDQNAWFAAAVILFLIGLLVIMLGMSLSRNR